MYKITTNITKGIVGRLKSSKSSNKYDLSWLQRKVLKHQDDTSIKEYKFANFRSFIDAHMNFYIHIRSFLKKNYTDLKPIQTHPG
jgi:hypothetical protein